MNISDPSAQIEITGKLSLGEDCTFSAVTGSEIHMTGAELVNKSDDPVALGGLGNLTLIFEGGAAVVDDVEVAGEDLGAVPAGWNENFALGVLTLGGVDVGQIQLVDNHDNDGLGQGACEAIG